MIPALSVLAMHVVLATTSDAPSGDLIGIMADLAFQQLATC